MAAKDGLDRTTYAIETFQKQTVVLCLAHIDCKKSAERIIYNNCRQGSVVDCDAALGFKAFNGYHYAEVAALIIADIAVTYREVKRIISDRRSQPGKGPYGANWERGWLIFTLFINLEIKGKRPGCG